VNVLVGADAISVKCAYSYYVVADSEGNIICSTPSITRHYEQGGEEMSREARKCCRNARSCVDSSDAEWAIPHPRRHIGRKPLHWRRA
jgi:hypothetical protein